MECEGGLCHVHDSWLMCVCHERGGYVYCMKDESMVVLNGKSSSQGIVIIVSVAVGPF